VEAALRFESGVLAAVHLDYLQRSSQHFVEVVGHESRARWEARTGELVVSRAQGEVGQHLPPEGFDRNDMFVEEMKHFVGVVSGGQSHGCSLADGIRVQEVLDQVRHSAERAPEAGGE
jgi:hypothetical protein